MENMKLSYRWIISLIISALLVSAAVPLCRAFEKSQLAELSIQNETSSTLSVWFFEASRGTWSQPPVILPRQGRSTIWIQRSENLYVALRYIDGSTFYLGWMRAPAAGEKSTIAISDFLDGVSTSKK